MASASPSAGKKRKMTLDATEFLRRFFLHILPKGFVRIRHFGFLANRFRSSRLTLCRQLVPASLAATAVVQTQPEVRSNWQCPHCGGPMILLVRLTSAELSRCNYFDSS
jgi:hypothetical protein